MKDMRKLLAVTLLILTLGIPAYAEGQMETPRPTTPGQSQTQPLSETPEEEGVVGEDTLTQNGQMETPKSAVLCVIETILALI